MIERHTVRRSAQDRRKAKTDRRRVDAMSEAELAAAAAADPDGLPTDAAFWKTAKLVMPERKVPVSLRLDRDVVDWFKSHGRGYQSRINAVLRSYMNAGKGTG